MIKLEMMDFLMMNKKRKFPKEEINKELDQLLCFTKLPLARVVDTYLMVKPSIKKLFPIGSPIKFLWWTLKEIINLSRFVSLTLKKLIVLLYSVWEIKTLVLKESKLLMTWLKKEKLIIRKLDLINLLLLD